MVVLRDPIARAYPAGMTILSEGVCVPDTDGGLSLLSSESGPWGGYAPNMALWLVLFQCEHLLVLNLERDIRNAPQNGMRKLFNFIGVLISTDIE